MTRARTWLSIVLPSLLAGGVLFGSAFGRADSGHPVAPPAPHAPVPPVPPAPPRPDGSVDLAGLRAQIDAQIATALDSIRTNPQIPQKARDKLSARLDKMRARLDKRLGKLGKVDDLAKLGEELDGLGEEMADVFDGIDSDFDGVGESVTAGLLSGLANDLRGRLPGHAPFNFGSPGRPGTVKRAASHDDDDDEARATPDAPDVEIDDDDGDTDDAIGELRDLALTQPQRDAITKIRADVKATVEPARKRIGVMSTKLHDSLGNVATSDAEISRAIDAISADEATIRKARILAWVSARRTLDAAQRQRVESAAKKTTK